MKIWTARQQIRQRLAFADAIIAAIDEGFTAHSTGVPGVVEVYQADFEPLMTAIREHQMWTRGPIRTRVYFNNRFARHRRLQQVRDGLRKAGYKIREPVA